MNEKINVIYYEVIDLCNEKIFTKFLFDFKN